MRSVRITLLASVIAGAAAFGPGAAKAAGGPAAADVPPGVAAQGPAEAAPQENPIPPGVEGQAVPYSSGGYCYGGPHPAPGGGWEAVQTAHVHDYAPFDMRLFTYRAGCYYFIGDPRDFGYTGQVYSYYGAHPVADVYGGGWCFMIGPHTHWWRPWSPYFTVVGPWNYWYGPYDPFFWAYWPYYSFYYRSYYPSFYAGGRFYTNGYRVAPAITRVPSTGWRGTAAGSATAQRGGAWRGTAPGGTAAAPAWRGSPAQGAPAHAAPGYSGGYRPPATGGGWHAPPPSGGGWRGGSVPYAAPHGGGGGGFHFHGGGGRR
jgi:hypothetical protein